MLQDGIAKVPGAVIGEKRFLGLYASSAYTCELDDIPLVRSKIILPLSKVEGELHGFKNFDRMKAISHQE
nr:NAD-glutamate dehydrogenase [Bathymodiolus platifrons methanotrophic gill symbiont]